VYSGGCFVGQPQLGPVVLFFSFGFACCEHQLQGPHLLVRQGKSPARDLGFAAGNVQTLLPDDHLDLAPVQQALEVAECGDGQGDANRRALGGVDLHQHHLHARLGLRQLPRLLLDAALVLRVHLLRILEEALALLEG
jgi:hypothetical protein